MSYNNKRPSANARSKSFGKPAQSDESQDPSTSRRDFRRLNQYNESRAAPSWSDRVDVEERYDNWRSKNTQGTQQGQKTRMAPRQPPRGAKGPPPSRDHVDKPTDDVFNIDTFSGAEPIHAQYSQNLDHGVFDLLMDVSHQEIRNVDANFAKKVPLVMYRHYNNMLLQAKLIDLDRKQNSQNTLGGEGEVLDLFPADVSIHKPLYEYLSNIGECVTQSGDHVTMNLPPAAIPQLEIEQQGNVPVIRSGSFGAVNQHNHNAYECYISPLVTRNN